MKNHLKQRLLSKGHNRNKSETKPIVGNLKINGNIWYKKKKSSNYQ